MASHMFSVQSDHVRATIAEAKGLTVDRLKKVLKSENLQVSGIKSELQIRLIAHIEKAAQAGEHDRISRIRNSIRGVAGSYPNPYPSPYSTNTPTASLSPQFQSPTPRPQPPTMSSYPMHSYSSNRLNFKSSPFYTIIRQLAPQQELKPREQTRDAVRINVMLDLQTIEQLRDTNTRIMVFCAAESFENRNMPCDISFPQHGELKCNSEEVKANLKGLKNKPGTTRPADITSHIRPRPNASNVVELVYALTNKKYHVIVNLVQKKPVNDLLAELRRGKFISKERVIREMQTKASDPDIVATSSIMSLKDPVQMTRIQTPCRSMACKHNECFDAAVYLNLQEQAPTWTCPFCNRSAPWENLIFDQYFNDILSKVSADVESVTVEPNGKWITGDAQNPSTSQTQHDDSDDDEDDIVILPDPRRGHTREFIRTPSVLSTPPLPGSSSMSQTGSKRRHTETIDLTGDDSEEEQAPRPPPKRSNTSNSFGFVHQYQSPPEPTPYRFQMPPPPSSSNNYNSNSYYNTG